MKIEGTKNRTAGMPAIHSPLIGTTLTSLNWEVVGDASDQDEIDWWIRDSLSAPSAVKLGLHGADLPSLFLSPPRPKSGERFFQDLLVSLQLGSHKGFIGRVSVQ